MLRVETMRKPGRRWAREDGEERAIMELLVMLAVLVLFDLAVLRWGRDSRNPARDLAGTGGILPR
jgi:hypothetical protein